MRPARFSAAHRRYRNDRRAGAEEPPARDAFLAEGAAKAAIEADSYKRITVLGRGPSGTWRVKAYRGNTEVVVTVDGTGSVTME
jgi:hypothetical protein